MTGKAAQEAQATDDEREWKWLSERKSNNRDTRTQQQEEMELDTYHGGE